MDIELTPEARQRMKAALWGDTENYFGADTLTPQRAEIARLNTALETAYAVQDHITAERDRWASKTMKLRDALAEANGIIEDLHGRCNDLTCERDSLRHQLIRCEMVQ